MVEDATDRWYDAWESKLTNHPLDHNVLRVKSAIPEPSVRRHIEPWMTWWQQKLFADHAQFVRNRINWVKANLGVKQPRERFSDLDVKFSLDVGQAIAFFCGEYLHVRTPLHQQWTAVSSVFNNPYQAERNGTRLAPGAHHFMDGWIFVFLTRSQHGWAGRSWETRNRIWKGDRIGSLDSMVWRRARPVGKTLGQHWMDSSRLRTFRQRNLIKWS
jgi:hypothetical protein